MKKEEIKQFLIEILSEHNYVPIAQLLDVIEFNGKFNIIDEETGDLVLPGVTALFASVLFELQDEELIAVTEIDDVVCILKKATIMEKIRNDEQILYS